MLILVPNCTWVNRIYEISSYDEGRLCVDGPEEPEEALQSNTKYIIYQLAARPSTPFCHLNIS